MTTKTPANHARKIQALLKKTVAAGCEPAEAASALSMASTITTKHKLDPANFTWPEPPAGYRWEGTAGRGGTIVETPVTSEPTPKAKRPRKPATPKIEPKPKKVTVGERVVAMLRRKQGATIAELMAELGVQAHSARALISVEARKKRGLDVRINRATGRYTIAVE
jgi:hypothetical protein